MLGNQEEAKNIVVHNKEALATTRKRPTNGAPNLAINGALVVRH